METQEKRFSFLAVLQPDEDGWFISVPELQKEACYSWGQTKEDALKNIQEVIEMILEEFQEEGRELPSGFGNDTDDTKIEVKKVEVAVA